MDEKIVDFLDLHSYLLISFISKKYFHNMKFSKKWSNLRYEILGEYILEPSRPLDFAIDCCKSNLISIFMKQQMKLFISREKSIEQTLI